MSGSSERRGMSTPGKALQSGRSPRHPPPPRLLLPWPPSPALVPALAPAPAARAASTRAARPAPASATPSLPPSASSLPRRPLLPHLLQQHRGRLVFGVLGDQLAAKGLGQQRLPQPLGLGCGALGGFGCRRGRSGCREPRALRAAAGEDSFAGRLGFGGPRHGAGLLAATGRGLPAGGSGPLGLRWLSLWPLGRPRRRGQAAGFTTPPGPLFTRPFTRPAGDFTTSFAMSGRVPFAVPVMVSSCMVEGKPPVW